MTEQDEAGRGGELAGDEMRYRHVIQAVAERPWAMHPDTLAVIVDLLRYRSAGHRLTRAEVDERIASGQERFAAARGRATKTGAGGAVAVLPLFGVIAPRAAAFQSVSSPNGTGVDAFTQMFRQALADPSVGSILIEVDSPGGQVGGIPELAAEIRGSRGDKPIVAIANFRAASAAYWIASQADELVLPPSGEVGSVGVYAAHEDLSGKLEQDGVKMTLVSAGKYKVEGNPFEPLSEEARAAIQADVDAFYAMFVSDVAKGRGVSVEDVRTGFGEGRMVMAAQAVKAGMADRVATFDETVARLARGEAPAAKPRALADAVAAEKNAADDPRQNDPEGGTPSTLDHVADAERLLAYDAVREAFPTRA
ncbi:MAG TPA: S49 family peptidase [Gaiellaceae bacterium]|jgi:signal peptide peptidase SppA|nr:S49 family peptidase [Gaiellaceae bacterium]